MVRAIFFDFYSVWTPDRFQEYLKDAQTLGKQESADLADLVELYYQGEVKFNYLADVFKYKLNRMDIDKVSLTLHATDISPEIISLLQVLHGHFLKIGVLANLGDMELGMLNQFNTTKPLFEVIISPSSLGLKAPLLSKQVFTKAVRAIGEPPSSCLVISGHDDYLTFAMKYGMQTIKYTGFDQLRQSLGDLLASDIPPSFTA